ncbi:serine protease FAM111A-like [Chaetodon auriga]|uniref:serine protease FAM111A-like n=1 Tax=Chaetodon auriga TaxID=39042 RepID=UPI0040330E17
MPPKKQKTKDIRSFFKKSDNPDCSSTTTENIQPGGAAGPRLGGAAGPRLGGAAASQSGTNIHVKKEYNAESADGHLHRLTVKFSHAKSDEYSIDCYQPRTVLQAIKSTEYYKTNMKKWSDENIVIQLGKEHKKHIVATHFPCCCIPDNECLIASCESEKVEQAQDQHYRTVFSRDEYSVFYIDREGGLNAKSKQLFRNKAVKQFKYLCVYGEKGITVEEALKRDGRFIDDLDDFTLSDNDNPNSITERTQKVDNLDQKKFKIRLPRRISERIKDMSSKRVNDEEQQKMNNLRQQSNTVLDVVHQKAISVSQLVRPATEKSGSSQDANEIYGILRQQFPALKELMESRFPNNSYQEVLNLRKEDFGKIQQSFSEVHRVRKLLKLGKSVCKVIVENVCQGTGFVLFDNLILTNAHLFEGCVEGERLKEGINVFALFNYEDPEPQVNYYRFQLAHRNICYNNVELDYLILELSPEGQIPNQTTQTTQLKVPPGLLKHFGPVPSNGEACIIGHPAGAVKKMDPTCIIEKEKRQQAVDDRLNQYKCDCFSVYSIMNAIKDRGIENIMMGGVDAEKVVTYNTFMYHGSSGSPVFDAKGQVFGLHTAGFYYELKNQTERVIEFAQPLLTIFEHFVNTLKEKKEVELLKRVKKEAKRNHYLKKVLSTMAAGTDEGSNSDEPMEID